MIRLRGFTRAQPCHHPAPSARMESEPCELVSCLGVENLGRHRRRLACKAKLMFLLGESEQVMNLGRQDGSTEELKTRATSCRRGKASAGDRLQSPRSTTTCTRICFDHVPQTIRTPQFDTADQSTHLQAIKHEANSTRARANPSPSTRRTRFRHLHPHAAIAAAAAACMQASRASSPSTPLHHPISHTRDDYTRTKPENSIRIKFAVNYRRSRNLHTHRRIGAAPPLARSQLRTFPQALPQAGIR